LPCDKLPLGSPQYAVVVGGSVFTLGGSIHNGDLAYLNPSSNVSVSTGFNPGCYAYGAPTNPIPVNFAGWETYFQQESLALCDYNKTGTTTLVGDGTLILTGTNSSDFEFFTINGSDLASSKTVSISNINPSVGGIIINVRGNYSALRMGGMQSLAPFNSKILWNFCEATTIDLGCIDIAGSILLLSQMH